MNFMYSRSFVHQDPKLRILLPTQQRNRLRTTCFRENGQPLAGNFYRWKNDAQFLADPIILKELIAEAMEVLRTKKEPYGTWSVEIEYPSFVGWASAVHLEDIPFEIEEFRPNRWTRAWRVKDPMIPAPLTNILTVIYFLDQPRGDVDTPAMIIQSIYPGHDTPLGSNHEPRDIEWHEAIFFPWENPGSVEELKGTANVPLSQNARLGPYYTYHPYTLLAP